MSNTRRRSEGEPPTQQGYCSSVEFERGLFANIVGARCAVLDDPRDKDFILSLQRYSWLPGGLKGFTHGFLTAYPDRLCTPSMRKFGMKPGQMYSANQVRIVRAEMPLADNEFLLSGELSGMESLTSPDIPERKDDYDGSVRRRLLLAESEVRRRARSRPNHYPVEAFQAECRYTAHCELPELLAQLCLDAKVKLSDVAPWYCPTLIESLREHLITLNQTLARAGEDSVETIETELGRMVHEGLDYALATRELTMIYGDARTGKTRAAKSWAALHPGQARYVQVPPSDDAVTFIRRIAEAYGVSSCLAMKSTQLREKVEKTARLAGLMLILDEGHLLLTQDYRCRKRPFRIQWVMNELVNYGVPVAILSTPQFEADKARIKERTGWNWDQWDGRIGVPIVLPKEVSEDDLTKIAKAHLPDADAATIKKLVGYALYSNSQAAAIGHVVKRARFQIAKAGRQKVTLADIAAAISERLPLDGQRTSKPDSALAAALHGAESKRPRDSRKQTAVTVPAPPSRNGSGEPLLATDRTRQPATLVH